MAFKSILTVATGPEGLVPLLRSAAAVTVAADGHLDVLALGIDAMQPAVYGFGGSFDVLRIALDHARSAAGAIAAEARAALGREDPALRWTVEPGIAAAGMLRAVVALRAQYSDLVVLPRPYGALRQPEDVAVVEAALFEGRAPVLLLPEGSGGVAGPRHVIVAWNQSPEAMAAVRRAMPLLRGAGRVTVAMIDPPSGGPEGDEPGAMLCRMLVRQGAPAEVAILPRGAARLSEALLRHVREQGGDLVVMGAYGHSRLREAVLGGATRSMLEQAHVPLLVAR